MAISCRYLFLSLLGLLYAICPAIAGRKLCVIFESSPRWKTLTPDQKRCTTENVSPAWNEFRCYDDKDCFCNDPAWMDEEVMDCVTQYIRGNPLDAYNGAMYFYATECGTFQFQKKDFLSQSVTFSKTYPTSTPQAKSNPSADPDPGLGVQAIPTTGTTQQTPAPTSTKSVDSSQGSTGSQSTNSNPDVSLGGIIGITAGVCTILALFVAIYMCWCRR